MVVHGLKYKIDFSHKQIVVSFERQIKKQFGIFDKQNYGSKNILIFGLLTTCYLNVGLCWFQMSSKEEVSSFLIFWSNHVFKSKERTKTDILRWLLETVSQPVQPIQHIFIQMGIIGNTG